MSLAEVVALIPARAGSKGVRDKNVRRLGGLPLLVWTIAACQRSSEIDRVIVSTDSPEYAALGREYGAEVPFLRPAEISGDGSTDLEFVVHALDFLGTSGQEPRYIVHMRPTTPFREPAVVDEAVRTFANSTDATALRSVHRMSESAWKSFALTGDGWLQRLGADDTELDDANMARQTFPETYVANGYVDVLSVEFIRRSRLLHGDHVLPFFTPVVTEVDTEHEIVLLERELQDAPYMQDALFE